MNIPNRTLFGSIASVLVLLAVRHASAQSITWGAATTMSANADVLTTGALDRAYIFGGAASVNGVAFSNFLGNPLGDSTGAGLGGYPGAAYQANGSAFPNYANLSGPYQQIAAYGVYSNDGNGSLTLTNLNAGLDYTLQAWVNDSREFGPGGPIGSRTGSIGGSPTLDYNVQNDTGGVGQFATGTFTGSAASKTLTFSANASAQINALQLRATGVSAGNTAVITAPQNWMSSSLVVQNGGTLDLASAELFNYTQSITINGAGVGGIGAIYKSTPGNGALLQLRSIALGSDASIGGVATSRIDIGRGDWTGPGNGAPIHIDGQGHTLSVVGGTYLGILAEAQNLAGVVVRTGALVAPHNDNSFASATVTLDGGTLTPWNNHTFSNNLVVTTNGGFIDNQGFFTTYTGGVQVNGALQINTIVGGNITVNGNISGSGAITKIGGYSVLLGGDNSRYTGTYSNNESNTIFVNDSAGSESAAWVANTGHLYMVLPGNHTLQLGSLAGTGGQLSNALASPDTGEVTYIIGGRNTSSTFSGTILDTVYQAGTTAIGKVGTGVLTLNGTLTYTGVTTTYEGTLNVESTLGAGANVVDAFGGVTNFSVDETLAELNIGPGAVVNIGPAGPAVLPASLAAVPEPGAVVSILSGLTVLLGQRRRW